jgi:DNA polymerase I-like protein with 3'-5' exonuclease and polymerase domains
MYDSFKIIKTEKELDRLIKYCKQTGYTSVDFETNAQPIYNNDFLPTILGVSFQPGSAYIIPLAHFDSPFIDCWKKILKKFGKEVIENPDIVKIAQNLKFEYNIFTKYKIQMKGRLFDTMLAKYLLDEEKPHGLKEMVTKWLPDYSGYESYEGSTLPWDKKPLLGLSEYCAMDCDLTFRLMVFFEKLLIDNGFYPLFRNMLMMATRVLAESEYKGLKVDIDYLTKLKEKKEKEMEELMEKVKNHPTILRYNQKKIIQAKKDLIQSVKDEISKIRLEMDKAEEELSNVEFNKFITAKRKLIKAREDKISRYIINEFTTKKELEVLEPLNLSSPNQLRDLFFYNKWGFKFDVIKYTVDKGTKKESKRPSTDEEVLMKLKPMDDTGFISLLLTHRAESKIYGTYIKGMYDKLSDKGGVHGRFLLEGTVTGRLASREPNLQNIPRGSTAAGIKEMFIPPDGYLMMQLDYSQAELRVLAAVAKETSMLEWFNTGKDIHLASACKKFKAEYDDIIKIYENESHPDYKIWNVRRKQAKTINFGIIYGQGAKLLAESLSDPEKGVYVSVDDASQFLKDFHKAFPRISKFIKKCHNLAHEQGYVRNLFGRKRRLTDIDSDETWKVAEAERQSVNAPIQGAASDFTLFSSILIRNYKLNGKLPKDLYQCATVHDSLIFYIKPGDIHKSIPILYDICRNPQTKEWFGFEINSVEMAVDFEIGTNWGSLKKYNKEMDYTKLLNK